AAGLGEPVSNLGEEKQGHYRITGFFDLYCTPGPHMTAIFDGLQRRHGHFLVRETGWPKLDSLNLTDQRAERKKSLGLDPDKPVLLYAPTFSPKLTSAPVLFSEIRALQSRGYQWICKFHSLEKKALISRYQALESPAFQIAKTDDILPLMEAADILITDTSSVAYEFLLLDRPIITYRARARQDKGLDITTPDDLEGAIVRSLLDPGEFSPVRHEILEELHPYRDGQSSQRVVETVQDVLAGGELETLRPKPANRFRKWQLQRMFP
ncbi:MAG: CDP-glycerol glycerophosphotransferase family protein, partial [Fidelibacterota bacterium]